MKKSLFALAALGAFASAAQAQSSVTLYGTFDASAVQINNGTVTQTTSSATTSSARRRLRRCSGCRDRFRHRHRAQRVGPGPRCTSPWGRAGG